MWNISLYDIAKKMWINCLQKNHDIDAMICYERIINFQLCWRSNNTNYEASTENKQIIKALGTLIKLSQTI